MRITVTTLRALKSKLRAFFYLPETDERLLVGDFFLKYKNQLLVLTEAEFNSFFDVLQCTFEQLLEAMSSVRHLQSLQQKRKYICKLITSGMDTIHAVCSCSGDEENS